MAQLRLKNANIERLEDLADGAFKLFRDIPKAKKQVVRHQRYALASAAYGRLGDCLRQSLIRDTNDFENLNKGGKRAAKVEKYILQYVLGHGRDNSQADYTVDLGGDSNDGMGGLKAYLDAKDADISRVSRKKEEGALFRIIRNRSARLRGEGKFQEVFNALTYVREKYTAA